MKYSLVIVSLLLSLHSFSQANDGALFYPLSPSADTAKIYGMVKNSYVCFFLDKKHKINGKEYFVMVTRYSKASVDTSFLRIDSVNIWHYDKKNGLESVVLPRKLEKGATWLEADGSWRYEITGIGESLKTPAGKYKDLLLVTCRQLTGRDPNKLSVYQMYYASGIGVVAAVNNDRLVSWLAEIKTR